MEAFNFLENSQENILGHFLCVHGLLTDQKSPSQHPLLVAAYIAQRKYDHRRVRALPAGRHRFLPSLRFVPLGS